jgi:tRNA dimethylallyltransferase
LQAAPRPLCDVAAQAIGYREVIAMLSGQATKSQTIERVQARTRQFAKRQATWFRGLEEVRWVPVEPEQDSAEIADQVARRIDSIAFR